MRRLVLVEIEAASPLDAEALVGGALVNVPGNPFVRQTGVIGVIGAPSAPEAGVKP